MPEEQAMSKSENPAQNAAVGIGPIKLADYLDQSKLITRTSDNRMIVAEYDQWAGSLESNLTNVLAENIGFLLPTDQIYFYPWRTSVPRAPCSWARSGARPGPPPRRPLSSPVSTRFATA